MNNEQKELLIRFEELLTGDQCLSECEILELLKAVEEEEH